MISQKAPDQRWHGPKITITGSRLQERTRKLAATHAKNIHNSICILQLLQQSALSGLRWCILACLTILLCSLEEKNFPDTEVQNPILCLLDCEVERSPKKYTRPPRRRQPSAVARYCVTGYLGHICLRVRIKRLRTQVNGAVRNQEHASANKPTKVAL